MGLGQKGRSHSLLLVLSIRQNYMHRPGFGRSRHKGMIQTVCTNISNWIIFEGQGMIIIVHQKQRELWFKSTLTCKSDSPHFSSFPLNKKVTISLIQNFKSVTEYLKGTLKRRPLTESKRRMICET